ncbi:MAG: helix-turn-helix domain-containing protein [Salinivirgaceae bacterium]
MSMHRMGERIKKRRESLKLAAGDLASSIGVTPSLISQIERAKAFPSILTLKKVADALNTTVGELIGENGNLIEHPLLKQDERKFVKKNKTGTKSYLLSHHDPQKQMDPFLLHFEKKGDSGEIMTPQNPRQEFLFVLKGKFRVSLSQQTYELNEGDSFYFISNQPHLFANTNNGPSELLWVVNQSN